MKRRPSEALPELLLPVSPITCSGSSQPHDSPSGVASLESGLSHLEVDDWDFWQRRTLETPDGKPWEHCVHLYITHICGSEELMIGEKFKASSHLALFRCLTLFFTWYADFCTAPTASLPVHTHTHTLSDCTRDVLPRRIRTYGSVFSPKLIGPTPGLTLYLSFERGGSAQTEEHKCCTRVITALGFFTDVSEALGVTSGIFLHLLQ